MMIKVRHTDCQLYVCANQSAIRRHGRNVLQEIEMGVLKSEIEPLYPRWPLSDAVIARCSQFSRRATLDTIDLDKMNNFVNTYLDCRKK